VFYVNLRGDYESEQNRTEALSNPEQARRKAYRHFGRFDNQVLRMLDSREEARDGDQFGYRLTNDGELHKNSREALGSGEFKALLDSVQENFRRMGHEVFSGVVKVDPYRKGTMTACGQCSYRSICRIDPWTHRYRLLKD
jgi:ATP-dependent helicase/nuclease subunit B